jgi:formylglycine-generating enzyme required for sulfatase activity
MGNQLSAAGLRAARGGGSGAAESSCRIGYRTWQKATDVIPYFGFRIARFAR